MNMNQPSQEKISEREKVVAAAKPFTPLLSNFDLTAEEIDAAIEELRPLRMHLRALEDGDAPGFRKTKPVKIRFC